MMEFLDCLQIGWISRHAYSKKARLIGGKSLPGNFHLKAQALVVTPGKVGGMAVKWRCS